MQFHDEGRKKQLTIPDRFETTVTAIRGADGQSDAVTQNLHNVLHGPIHTLVRGHTQYRHRVSDFNNGRTHGLYSLLLDGKSVSKCGHTPVSDTGYQRRTTSGATARRGQSQDLASPQCPLIR